MKSRKFWYIVVTFVAGLLVTFSMLMPGVLLSKAEDSVLDSPFTVSDGTSPSQQHGPGVTSTPSASSALTAQLTRDVQLFYEQGTSNSVLTKENINGTMDIKKAVDVCIQQILALLKKGALPPLDGFPGAYYVNAELRTIIDNHGNPTLQYWSINFARLTDQSTTPTKMAVLLDAQTGMFLSIKAYGKSTSAIDLVNSAETIAQSMNMPGKLLSLDLEQVTQKVVWKVNASPLLMQLFLTQKDPFTTFTMAMTVNKS
ncbi:MAG: hypothetical protein JOZ18_23735 [Chloroflexi bacterium]|nr:hypothetical protein [Chloroflexota bacterium]